MSSPTSSPIESYFLKRGESLPALRMKLGKIDRKIEKLSIQAFNGALSPASLSKLENLQNASFLLTAVIEGNEEDSSSPHFMKVESPSRSISNSGTFTRLSRSN